MVGASGWTSGVYHTAPKGTELYIDDTDRRTRVGTRSTDGKVRAVRDLSTEADAGMARETSKEDTCVQ